MDKHQGEAAAGTTAMGENVRVRNVKDFEDAAKEIVKVLAERQIQHNEVSKVLGLVRSQVEYQVILAPA